MSLQALIPFRPTNPKTRLAGILSQSEREEFAHEMLNDVISAVNGAGGKTTLLTTSNYDCDGALVVVRNVGLNEALNWALPQYNTPVMIIMSDLPLTTPENILDVVATEADVAIVPGLGGGTNILYIKDPSNYKVEYYGFSYRRHVEIAKTAGLTVEVIDSMRMSTDVDEPSDLVELMIHGHGRSNEWLYKNGFALSTASGRVSVLRNGEKII